ncbi:MAG: hypothetical protein ACI9MJ_002722, partial [Alphaproteobacteria bacterium]
SPMTSGPIPSPGSINIFLLAAICGAPSSLVFSGAKL